MRRFIRSLALLVPCLVVPCLHADDKTGKFEVINVPEVGVDFAIHAENGTLAVLSTDKPELILCPDFVTKRETGNRKTVKVGRKSTEVAFKTTGGKNYFVVLSAEESALYVVDADKGELLDKIAIQMSFLRSLAVSNNPNDPYAYYCGGAGNDCRIGRVNLKKLTNEGVLREANAALRVMISGDGSILIANGVWTGGIFEAFAIDPETAEKTTPTVRKLHNDQNPTGNYVADPFGQYVISESRVMSPDFKRQHRKLSVLAHFASTARPLIVSLQEYRALFLSANTFEEVGSTQLPKEFQQVKKEDRFAPRIGPAPPQAKVLEHPPSQSLLLCRGKNVALLSMKNADLPNEPFMSVRPVGPTQLTVGVQHEVDLRVSDPALKMEVKNGPKGLRLEGRKLVWTPSGSDVGTHPVSVQLSAGKLEVARELTLTVRQSAVELPFAPTHLAVASDGSAALALGADQSRPNPAVGFNPDVELNRLALVDLKKPAVTVEHKLLVPVRTVALDRHYVYASASGSDVIYALDRKDLSDVKKLFTNGRVRMLVPVGDRLLFVTTDSNQTLVLKVPELTPAESADVGVGIHLAGRGDAQSKSPPIPLGKAWWFDGCLYDTDFSKPLAVAQPSGFWTNSVLRSDISQYQPMASLTYPSWTSPWSVVPAGNGFQHGKRSVQIGTTTPGVSIPTATILLAEKPAAAAAKLLPPSGLTTGRHKLVLQFLDLDSGTLNLEVPLRDEHFVRSTSPYDRIGIVPRLIEQAGILVVVSEGQLYAMPVPALETGKFPTPLHFVRAQPVNVLDSKVDRLPLPKLIGGKAPFEIAFRQDVPGLEVDGKSHELRIDREAIVQQAMKVAVSAMSQSRGTGGKVVTAEEVLTEYVRNASARFSRLAGRKATGVPIWLSVGLLARDENLQTATIDIGFFVELPLSALEEKAKALRSEVMAGPGIGLDPRRPLTSDELIRALQQMDAKVNRLERQLSDLHETINRLNRLLEKK